MDKLLIVARSDARFYSSHELAVGEKITHYAGAPGIGRIVYRITREDADGWWGYVIEDTIRELDPSEVY